MPTAVPQEAHRGSASVITLSSPIAGERVSEREAAQRLPYRLPHFDYLPSGVILSEVWVSPVSAPPEARSLALVFTKGGAPVDWGTGSLPFIDGVLLVVHQDPIPMKWASLAEPPFKLVEVNNFQGVGTDPGTQTLSDGSLWYYPGSVEWQVGNLIFTMYGESPLGELLKVARSLHQ